MSSAGGRLVQAHAGQEGSAKRACRHASSGRAASAATSAVGAAGTATLGYPRAAAGARRGSGRVSQRGRAPDIDQPGPSGVDGTLLPRAEAPLPGPPGPVRRLRHADLLRAGQQQGRGRAGRVRELRRAAAQAAKLLRVAGRQAAGRGVGVRRAVDDQRGRRAEEGDVPADGGARVLAGGSGGRGVRAAGARLRAG